MFNLRHKRTTRDRQSGLVFQWRLPVGNTGRFLLAFVVVALVTAGLAASVRVRVGSVSRQPERRGSLILVPQGKEWQSLEMLALEAGPMPRRADPAGDPAVKDLIDRSMAAARPPGYRYEPELRAVTVEIPTAVMSEEADTSPGVLPPLPVPEPPSQNPPLPDPSRPLVLSNGGVRAIAPAAMLPASLARGNRYLLGYDANGRVTRVTTLFTAEPAADDSGQQWLRQIIIEGGDKAGGWTAVEISSGS
ncbi:hypothetical protein OKA05_26775 [Luteolibacter arcticus]|uniref:General secretion pathway protein GspB n=1 Tax=Luteolibacter arcticus TaxID=1581411 RepID=A0ABT3GRN3_9BACT|nr:hypothetical protein [Luteolibacter arcticus]MCW1926191.1 hypothetical protein [Luteolibacter arcticus]